MTISILVLLISSCSESQKTTDTDSVTPNDTNEETNIKTQDNNSDVIVDEVKPEDNTSVEETKTETTENNSGTIVTKEVSTVEETNLITNNEKMKKEIVSKWDNIEVNYKGTLEDGTEFDSSYKRNQTLPFTVWAGQMIAWFDAGVVWMKLWEMKTIEIEPKDAYGEYDPEKKQVVPKTELVSFTNAGFKLEKWEKLPTQTGELTVLDADKETVTLDLNHALAWKKLIFEVKIESIK